jgi:hypothetical protein
VTTRAGGVFCFCKALNILTADEYRFIFARFYKECCKFDGVPVGETYILTVSSRKYFFAEPTRIVNVEDNADDIDFVGQY